MLIIFFTYEQKCFIILSWRIKSTICYVYRISRLTSYGRHLVVVVVGYGSVMDAHCPHSYHHWRTPRDEATV